MTTKELLEQRAGLILAAQKLLDGTEEGRALTSEDEAKFDKMMSDADAIDAQLRSAKRYERVTEAARSLEQPANRIAAAFSRASSEARTSQEYETAFRSYLRTGDNTELRVMSYGTAANGGYTVPETVEARVVEKMRQSSVIRSIARTTVTPDDRKIPIQNAIPTAAIIGEGSSITASDATFTQLSVDSYKYATRVIASRELIQDSGINLEEYVIRNASEAIARAQDEHFWDGTDSGQPMGVIKGATAGTPEITVTTLGTGNATSLASADATVDKVLDWIYSLPVQYRMGSAIVTSDEVLKNLRKLRNTAGDYLWQASPVERMLAGGPAGTILGYPYYISEYVDAMAASKIVAVFGNFNYYEIFDRGATEIVVDPYSLSSTWQLQMVVVKRTDALRTLDEAFVALKTSAS
jgi:HK97 family phage major capsid protein